MHGIYGLVHRPILWCRLSSHFLLRTVPQKWLVSLIQIWHLDVTVPQGVLSSLVTVNSH